MQSTEPENGTRTPRQNSRYAQRGVRREYELWFKLQAVRETLAPGASVSVIARRHNINANMLFTWRRHYREGVLAPVGTVAKDGFVPVGVIGDQGEILPPAPLQKPAAKAPTLPLPPPTITKPDTHPDSTRRAAVPGSIELHLSRTVKVRLEGDVDQTRLRNVLAVAKEFI
jgi:transposase-like protein